MNKVATYRIYLTRSLPSLSYSVCLMEKLHLLALLLPILLGLPLLYIWDILWMRPERLRKKLRKQGVRGPRPTLFYGNTQEMKRIRQEAVSAQKQDTSNYISTLFPHFLIWRETYGM
uniref:Uncharacterized protein n=1 Tax=Aegilops tauschii subsp. strangulata TaxID=200361 RepID=A0A453HPA3_AEGTS